jgi:putative endonuclease
MRRSLGIWGEKLAADFLTEHGYSIMERNVRTPYGEIDLVARQDFAASYVIVMVEVKTRSSTKYGFPEEAVSHRKKEHLINSAEAFMQAHPELGGNWRIDVIAIQKNGTDSRPSIEHFVNAVTQGN